MVRSLSSMSLSVYLVNIGTSQYGSPYCDQCCTLWQILEPGNMAACSCVWLWRWQAPLFRLQRAFSISCQFWPRKEQFSILFRCLCCGWNGDKIIKSSNFVLSSGTAGRDDRSNSQSNPSMVSEPQMQRQKTSAESSLSPRTTGYYISLTIFFYFLFCQEQLVEMTGLCPRVIRVWFQNKRCKDKKKAMVIKQMQQQADKVGPNTFKILSFLKWAYFRYFLWGCLI